MNAGEETRNPLDVLAEEFVTRFRRGEAPDVEAYAEAHPDLADRIRELFPTLIVMEELAPAGQTEPDAPAEGVSDPMPSEIGGYRLVRELGTGGMGAVYEAVPVRGQLGTTTKVALKVLHRHLAHRPGFAERFLREAALGKRVEHPNVVGALDAGVQDEGHGRELAFLVMEYVSGSSLRDLADSLGGRIPEALLRHLARQIAQGLVRIHEEGIVHRDLKPSNVMVTEDREVRIMDLGVARLQDASDRVSSTGQFVGSVRYAAPEQFRGALEDVGPAADLYSLGVTLYELATGRHPFRAQTPYALMSAHLHEVAPQARDVDPDVSPFLSALLETLLRKDPGARIGDASTLHAVLTEGEASTWWADRRRDASSPTALVTRPALRHDVSIHGRDDALEELRKAFVDAGRTEGRVVLLRGEAGVGKTRLVDTFAAELERASARVLYGSYPPGGEQSALADALIAAFGDAGLREELTRLLSDSPELGPAFADHLRGRPPSPNAPPLDARTLRSLHVNLLKALAEERPLVWIVDDLHFAPTEDLKTVLALARAVPHANVVLLLTTRGELPRPLEEELSGFSYARDVTLDRLSKQDALDILAEALTRSPWANPLAERIATAAGGNPFFLLEMVREVVREREEGVLAGTSSPSSEGLRKLPIPDAVRDLVTVRLRGIREAERQLLECGALLGLEFGAETVAGALDRDILDVLQTLGALERRTGIVLSAEDHYRFDHHQILEILRDEIAPPLARTYHARIARVLARRYGADLRAQNKVEAADAARLAHHALRGGEIALGRHVLLPALEFHEHHFQSHEIMELVDLALNAAPPADPVFAARALLRRATATDILGLADEHEKDVHALTEAAEASGQGEYISRAYHYLGALERHQGNAEKAREWLEKALDLARAHEDLHAEHRTLLQLALRAGEVSDYATAVRHGEAARDIAKAMADPFREGQAAFSMASYTFFQGMYQEAIDHLSTALDLLEAAGPPAYRHRARAYGMQGNAHYALGRYDEAMVAYQASLEIARRTGDREVQAVNLENLGGTQVSLGRMGDALSNLRAGQVLGEEVVSKVKQITGLANLGSACLWAGRLGEAETLLHQACEEAKRVNAIRMVGYALHDLALLEQARGNAAEARIHAQGSLDARRPLGQEGLAASLLLLGDLVVRHGLEGDAAAMFTEAEEVAVKTGEKGTAARAGLWLAALGARDGEEVEVPERLALFDEVAVHCLRHRAGGGGDDLTRAEALLERAAETLATKAERETFRRHSPAWILYRELA